MWSPLLLFSVSVFWAAAVQAHGRPAKPNFTGKWNFNLAKSKLEIPPPTSSRFVVDHREPKFRLTRTHIYAERSDTITVEFTTDGKESVQDFGERRARIRAHWEGTTLVAEMSVTAREGEGANVVRYSLQDRGKTLVAVERFRSATLNYDNTWVFDRESRDPR
jgi:hypothetical protein